MPTPHRENVAERRRNERKGKSPYSQGGREKMFLSRWSPSIRGALSRLWYGNSTSEEPEKSTNELQDKETNEVSGDESQNESDSAMNASTMSEDQVLTQLTMPSPRHVRFDLPNAFGRVQPERASPSTPVRPPPVPYVAPLPPSSIRIQQPDDTDPITKVTNYLETVVRPRGGECTEVEALGLSLLLQSAVRGSSSSVSSPVGSSPSRDMFSAFNMSAPLKPIFTNPNTDIGAILATSTVSHDASPQRASPSRTLKQNPNGPISFDGGGSARPRYRSPSFGASSSWNRRNLHRDFGAKRPLSDSVNEQASNPTDGKRRRVGEDKETSIAEPSGSVLQSNGSGDDAINSTLSNGVASSSRSTAPLPAGIRSGFSRFTATTPVRPSPLRQSVRADSSSPGSSNASPNNTMTMGVQPTTSNGFIAEALWAVTPKKLTDSEGPKSPPEDAFCNPYQQGTGHTRKLTTRPLRPPPKPTRPLVATAKQPSPPPQKQSALELIQKAAPTTNAQTGLKRSHEETKTNGTASSSRITPVKATVIEVSDEDEETRPQKKQKQEVNTGKGQEKVKASREIITIDDDEDVVVQTEEPMRPSEVIEPEAEPEKGDEKTKSKDGAGPFPFPRRFPSAPKEPSPLRKSFQPDAPSSPESRNPEETIKAIPGSTAGVSGIQTSTTATPAVFSTRFGDAFPFGSSARPVFNPPSVSNPFTTASVSTSTTSSTVPTFGAAPSTPVFSGFTNVFAPSTSMVDSTPSTSEQKKPDELEKPEDSVPPPAESLTSTMATATVRTAALSTSNASTYETMTREKQEAANIPVSELPSFDFTIPPPFLSPELAAARQAALSLPVTELPTFTFDLLEPTSSVSATTQPPVSVFSITSIPQPASDITPKTEVKGFDWSAAGLKKPTSQGWKCTTCFIDNKDEVTKCVSCTTERPGTSTAATFAPPASSNVNPAQNAAPKAEVKGFDWSAAGLKKPVSQGWKCSTCFLENNGDVTECTVCKTVKPGLAAASGASGSATSSAPPPSFGGFSVIAKSVDSPAPKSEIKGFDWNAAGLKKPVSDGWKCPECFLENKSDVTKCVACTKEKPGALAAASTTTDTSAGTPLFGSSSTKMKPAFDWSASGMKKPEVQGWKCKNCFCNNNDDSTKCSVCAALKPDEAEKNTLVNASSSVGTTPAFGNFNAQPAGSTAFPFPALGSKPFGTGFSFGASTAGSFSSPFSSSGFSFGSKPPIEPSGVVSRSEGKDSTELVKKEENGDEAKKME